MAIVYFHVVAFLNWFSQISVIVSDESAACFVGKDDHELVHIDYLAFDMDVPHPISNLIDPNLKQPPRGRRLALDGRFLAKLTVKATALCNFLGFSPRNPLF